MTIRVAPSKLILTRCFLAASAATCAGAATSWMQPVLMHDLVVQRSMNEAQAGGVLTLEGVAMGAASLLMASLVKRQRAQAFALLGMGLAILGSLLTLLTHGTMMLYVSRLLVGCGVGATIMISNIVAANFPDPDRTYAQIGVVNLAYGAIAVAIYGMMLNLFPSATPYHFILLTFLICLPIMFLLPKLDMFDRAAEKIGEMKAALEDSGMRKRTIILATVTFSITLASGCMWSLYALIGEEAGLSLEQVNNAIAMAIFTGFAGMVLPAIVGSKLGRVLPFCLGLGVLTAAVMVLASRPTASLFYIAVCANVAAVYFILPYMSGAAARIDGGGNAAAYISGVFFFANSAAPLVAGSLVTTVGISFIAPLVVFIAICCALGFIYVERASDRIEKNRLVAPGTGEPHLSQEPFVVSGGI